ncbi:hypothetical protein BDV12DRAFT_48251 [Aspergillus spectabilis]
MLVDEEGLRTGRLTLVECNTNGEIGYSIYVRRFKMRFPLLDISVLGKQPPTMRRNPLYFVGLNQFYYQNFYSDRWLVGPKLYLSLPLTPRISILP